MEVTVQSHHAADVSDRMRKRAERALLKLAERFGRPVSGTIRFESDGPLRRVELVLQAPRRKMIVAKGEARRYYSVALAQAIERMERQSERRKRRITARRDGAQGGR